jgi:hypothetical protein
MDGVNQNKTLFGVVLAAAAGQFKGTVYSKFGGVSDKEYICSA